ncbi:MAG: gamma-glutamylcyclotransferase [Aigarchaeota archaeon]|nr:gamma-glutamylcyclotransferase [Aigarchaeota archaeon]MCX8193017.1 gamma-glutamylcyclotransferase [Nitrososphaeria archaeon]MDW7986247.1 gamma-glutamylcyclotransferase family protein [Nitrososphaerota archaeon]
MSTEAWFFAYGWALDKNLLKKIIGDLSEPRKALLRGYRLIFDVFSPSWRGGVANIVEDEDGVVYGAVYKIKDEQFSKLDEVVGVPILFSKRKVIVEVEELGRVESITYVSTVGRGRWVKPSEHYLSALLRGLKQLRYSEDIIENVKKIAYGKLDRSRR